MSGTIKVKPADGVRVRQPDRAGLPIPPEGAIVADNSYYRRAVLTGDLIEVVEEEPAAVADEAPAEIADDPVPESPEEPAEAPRGRRRSPSTTEQE